MRLEGVQKSLAVKSNRVLFMLEARLKRDLDEVLEQIDMFWFQKSRTEAIHDGDRNTRLFHLNIVIRPKVNQIEALQDVAGNWHWRIIVSKL